MPAPRYATLLSTALAALLFLSASAWADQFNTTWRPGDEIRYRGDCLTAESWYTALATENPGVYLREQQMAGVCFWSEHGATAILEEWLAGPYLPPDGKACSIWEILTQDGQRYLCVYDAGGPWESDKKSGSEFDVILANHGAARWQCPQHSQALAMLAQQYGEAVVGRGLDPGGHMVELLATEDGSTWTLIRVTTDGQACPMTSGEAWRAVPYANPSEGPA